VVVERIDGVQKAEFSWQEGSGVVTYDSTRTSVEAVIRELHRMTDYEATVAPTLSL
jgi:copper chaperone CopZ